ncbi:MSHA biogenesis protein MshO [Massilia sp. MP_M2]|uniref:prepilin-type N-terminal cleavage/methylation domain-containing protein n=1 Tax=Massilia sp. MP_M2 TaxID=3071713 RepID=UPI00319DFF21
MKHISPRAERGFSLVELIVVIVLIGIVGGIFAMQVLPAIRAYLVVGQRAALTGQADTALRRIVADVRRAVPNSLRVAGNQCLELVPSSDGGRYRSDQDYSTATPAGAFLDDGPGLKTVFDVLTQPVRLPTSGDRIVIGNQNPNDVHGGDNVGTVNSAAVSTTPGIAAYSIALAPPGLRAPDGYTGARFMVVPRNEQTVAYVCNINAGTLRRITYPSLSPAPRCAAGGSTALVASGVTACNFVFTANQGATQQSGFVQLQLTLTGKGESVPLTLGAHVDNTP